MATQQHTYVDGNVLPAAWLNDEWTQLYTNLTDANVAAAAAIARSKLATTGADQADSFKANGLTGAVAASRYAGATASGKPVAGTFAVGDFVVDQGGTIWICTVAGTPGTWQPLVVAIGQSTATKVQSGQASVASVAAGATGSVAVTFATAFSTSATLSLSSATSDPQHFSAIGWSAASATGFTLYMYNGGASPATLIAQWLAIGN